MGFSMKSTGFMVAVAIAVFGIMPTSALSSTPAPAHKAEVVSDVTYISGGVGKS